MNLRRKKLLICIAIPLAVGGLSAIFTSDSRKTFEMLNKPFLSPPGWLFPVVWTVLYILMGIASYLVLTSHRSSNGALVVYGVQLVLNFFWPIFFFGLKWYFIAFLWLVILWLMILKTVILFSESSKFAGFLMVPYLLWVTFAGYLNFAIWVLN